MTNKNLKKSFSLFEVIISIVIASIIGVSSLYYLKDMVSFNKNNLEIEIRNLDLRTTKMFLQKNVAEINNLALNGTKLYFKNSLLLENVNSLTKNDFDKYYEINLNFHNKNYEWIIKK